MNRFALLTVCLVLGGLLFAACGLTRAQVRAVEEFSGASVNLGRMAGDEFVGMREATIALNSSRLSVKSPDEEEPGYDDLDEKFDPDVIEPRIQAVNTLQTYGELLLALVEADQSAEIRAAADRFVGSIGRLPGENQKLSDEQRNAISQIVQTAGIQVVAALKARAIRRIVPQARPQVQHLCALLAQDFDPEKPGLANRLHFTTGLAKTTIHEALDSANDLQDRERLMRMYEEVLQREAEEKAMLARMAEAIHNMSKANEALAWKITNPDVSIKDIQDFADSVKAIADAVKILRGE